MNPDIQQLNFLHDYLEHYRSDCLNYYAASLRMQGQPFESEATLLIRVRGGMLLDILIESLKNDSRTDTSSKFQECARQLLGAGYNYDNIKVMYDIIEKSVIETLQPNVNNGKVSLRPLKSALQLARVIAVNQYLSQVNNNLKAPSANVSSQAATPAPSQREEMTLRSENRPKTFDNMQITGVPKDYVSGRMDWPLRIVPGTKPPEYLARLENGNRVQVLLVDKPEAYERAGRINDLSIRCRLRFIGPLILAYPY